MPPKKKGGASTTSDEPKQRPLDILNEQVLLAKIASIEERNRALEEEVTTLRKTVKTHSLDENDVLEHVRRESATKDEIVSSLQDKIHQLMLEVQDRSHTAEQEMEKMTRQHRALQHKMEDDNNKLQEQLKLLEQFKKEKPQLEKEVEALRGQIRELQDKARHEMADIVRQYDVKEALVRKELEAKQIESENQLETRALQRVDAITQRTVQENMVKKEEIDFLHSELAILKKDNKKLSKEVKTLSNDLEISEEWRGRLLQRGNVLQSKVDLQDKRIVELEIANGELEAQLRQRDNAEIAMLREELEITKEKLRVAEKQVVLWQKRSTRNVLEPSINARFQSSAPHHRTLPSRHQIVSKLFPTGAESLLVHVVDGEGMVTEKTMPFTARGRIESQSLDMGRFGASLPPVTSGGEMSSGFQMEKHRIPVPPATSRT